jgi:hypothetical protein
MSFAIGPIMVAAASHGRPSMHRPASPCKEPAARNVDGHEQQQTGGNQTHQPEQAVLQITVKRQVHPLSCMHKGRQPAVWRGLGAR